MGISREQALDCFRSDDLIGIGMEADAVRRRIHREGVVSYVVERRIDCSGLGEAAFEAVCDALCEQVGATLDVGGTAVTLVPGGGRPSAEYLAGEETLRLYERMLAEIKRRHPAIWVSGLSAPEVGAIAASAGLGLGETLLRLRDAGLDSIGGEGVDVANPEPWVEVHRAAHGVGMRTTAAMVFGGTETVEQRADFLDAVGRLQEETGGFAAVVPLPCRAPGARELEQATAVESLKTLAIARMILDNIENVQSSWATQGLKVRQMGLRFGGNDVGAVALGDGASGSSEEDLRRVIRDAGFRPVQRSMSYRTMFLD
jgi:cyclic dehypoxanthinyl futalosine synthase